MYRSRVPGAPVVAAAQDRLFARKAAIRARTKDADVLRANVEPSDITVSVGYSYTA